MKLEDILDIIAIRIDKSSSRCSYECKICKKYICYNWMVNKYNKRVLKRLRQGGEHYHPFEYSVLFKGNVPKEIK